MSREAFEQTINLLKEHSGLWRHNYSYPEDLIDEVLDVLAYDDGYEYLSRFKMINKEIMEQCKFHLTTQEVYSNGEHYFAVMYDAPATILQEGGDTNLDVYEVVPKEFTVLKYVEVKEE